jgi:hypothetical protein
VPGFRRGTVRGQGTNEFIKRNVRIEFARLDLGYERVNRLNAKASRKRIQTRLVRGLRGLRTPTHTLKKQYPNRIKRDDRPESY